MMRRDGLLSATVKSSLPRSYGHQRHVRGYQHHIGAGAAHGPVACLRMERDLLKKSRVGFAEKSM